MSVMATLIFFAVIISFQCHMILQKLVKYDDLELKKHFWKQILATMLHLFRIL